jgi:hypothetical protein
MAKETCVDVGPGHALAEGEQLVEDGQGHPALGLDENLLEDADVRGGTSERGPSHQDETPEDVLIGSLDEGCFLLLRVVRGVDVDLGRHDRSRVTCRRSTNWSLLIIRG